VCNALVELVVAGVAVFRLVLLGEPGIEGSRLDLRNRRWVGEVRLAARRILGYLCEVIWGPPRDRTRGPVPWEAVTGGVSSRGSRSLLP